MRMTSKVYLMMACYESSISSRSQRDYTQSSSFHKPISAFHTDPYEESSDVFHVPQLFMVKEFISLKKLRR